MNTAPMDVPGWVRIVPLAAMFVVRCEQCKASDCVYFAGAIADPDMLRRVVESHAKCDRRLA